MLRTGLNLDVLHSFVPLNALSRSRLQDVLNGCRIQSLPAGTVLFRCGDPHVQSIFLLSGRLELTERDGEITLLDATDVAANHALAPTNPRQFNATALSTVNILAVNHQRLYDALLWEQSLSSLAQTLFAELPPDIDRDWVVRLLQSHVFYRVPPMNILALIRAMTPMNVREGEVIVRQGEQADSCYFIREGRAVVVQHEGRESVTMA
jgi:CRP-like cAMP-binding protein